MSNPTAAMLVIGDEILSGRTRDANAHHLAGVLAEAGIRLVEIRVVEDRRAAIVDAVRALSAQVDHLFTSGGIGPTHDDITADCVAEAFGVPIGVREDARAILAAHYGTDEINESRLRMARIPEGAALILNPVSQAPGFRLENVHVMAGVPAIFREMLANVIAGLEGGPRMLAHSFRVGLPEGDLAGPLRAVAEAHPAVSMGSYPFYLGGLGSTLVLRSTDPAALAAAADALRARLADLDAEIAETPPG
ncbi:molybdopterin-binding protein [Paralimibaculum aggregatum]|uniref:Molybdopterin-binding protein n=1 Tax=Paralimibaculum aggregatum TaxID=3036245 RepID=A0ABQ6LNN5_9RHOB|nr:molybdopterin-binding protein [Limibaculum sp. NKW23]GMG82828.1 molybdopterin-binding protein [Limibaculum sp. NKW23]